MTTAAKKLTVAGILAAIAAHTSAEENSTVATPTYSPTDAAPPTNWPTYWPTYSPTSAGDVGGLRSTSRCPSSLENYVMIDDDASMQYSIVSDDPLEPGIFCGRLFVDNVNDAGWAAVAFSESGTMVGSDAIVANLEEKSVLKYHLGGMSPADVTLMEEAHQTLEHTFVGVFGTMAVVEFTKLLVEENEVTINDDGLNIFLHARGDTWPGYHSSRIVFVDVVKKKIAPAVCDEERPCPDGEYCKLAPGACLVGSESHEGICVRIHDNCNWPVPYSPVCGCDGNEYGNECEVDEGGTSVAYVGQCEEATRQVDISPRSDDPCPENECRNPDGECAFNTPCFVDPCEVQTECSFDECEANYCGGCNHICQGDKNSDVVCTQDWNPVCGEDGVTYSNQCVAEKENVTIAFEGECSTTTQPSKPMPSSTISSLVQEEVCTPGGQCSEEGSSCTEGTETCCGETFPSLECDCMGGSWMCRSTDACMVPICCLVGIPDGLPPASEGFCSPGLACDTGIPDDYCCNDFANPGFSYCTQSGGGGQQTLPQPETNSPTISPSKSSSQPSEAKTTPFPTKAPIEAPLPVTDSPTSAPIASQTTTEATMATSTTTVLATTTTETTTTTNAPETTEATSTTTTTEAQPITTTTSTVPATTTTTTTELASTTTTVPATTTTTTTPADIIDIVDTTTTATESVATTTTLPETTTTSSTTAAAIEGRPDGAGAPTSSSEKIVVGLFSSLSPVCLVLAAWNYLM